MENLFFINRSETCNYIVQLDSWSGRKQTAGYLFNADFFLQTLRILTLGKLSIRPP